MTVVQSRPVTADASVKHSPFRPDVQGLRMIAVLAVIADHLLAYPRGGFVGVDVFFVISGYLITSLLLREYDRTRRISFRGFYIRRFKRIVPASLVVLGATLCAGYVLLDPARYRQVTWDGLASLLFSANWRFSAAGTDYFQEGLPASPLQHFWSLAVEEQFYLVWPWLMLAVLALGVRYRGWGANRRRIAVLTSIGALTAASFAWALVETAGHPTIAYFSTLSRAWELGAGACVAALGGAVSIGSRPARIILSWLGLAGIGVSLFVVSSSPGFPAPWAALPVLATVAVIVAGQGATDYRHLWPITNRLSRYIGDISYSLYLWHFPVVILLPTLVSTQAALYPVVALGLIGFMAVASYHWIEDPIRRSTWLSGSPAGTGRRRRLAVAAAASVAVLGLAGAAYLHGPPQGTATPVALAKYERCLGAAAMDPALGCPATQGDFVVPNPAAIVQDTAGAFDCWITEGGSMQSCSDGDEAAPVKVALVGDSHAAMLLPGLRPLVRDHGWRLDSYVGWGCQWMRTGTGSSCDSAMKDIQNRLTTGPRYDVVIVTAARQKTARDKAWVADMYAEAWRPVAARGTKIVVVADNPGVSAAALECVRRVGFTVADSACATPVSSAYAEVDALVSAATKVTGARLVDLRRFFCTDTTCPAVIGNVIVYRDTVGHITGTYSKTLGPYLVAAVDEAIAP